MSKKHFEMVARALSGALATAGNDESQRENLRGLAIELSAGFASENPRFDSQRFLNACGFYA